MTHDVDITDKTYRVMSLHSGPGGPTGLAGKFAEVAGDKVLCIDPENNLGRQFLEEKVGAALAKTTLNASITPEQRQEVFDAIQRECGEIFEGYQQNLHQEDPALLRDSPETSAIP